MSDVFRFPPTPEAPPPKNIHRATFFTVTGASGRPMTSAAYDTTHLIKQGAASEGTVDPGFRE